jgi:anti-sigma regulatory factor (Ser/Thr protein kinase)
MEASLYTHDLPATIQAERTLFQVPSLPEWIAPTIEFLKQKSLLSGVCEESRAAKLVLALHEALTNSIVHGNLEVDSALKERDDDSFTRILAERSSDPTYSGRMVTIEVLYDGDRCQWSLTDEGRGFDFDRLLNRAVIDEAEIVLASGRGILMMKAFMDEVQYELGGRRVLLAMRRDSGREKRQHPRSNVQKRVQVVPIRADGTVDWSLAYQAVTQNLSTDGIAILQSRLATSDRVLITMESVGSEPLMFHARVRHFRAVNGGLVELGCQFLPELADSGEPQSPRSLESAIDAILDGLAASEEMRDEHRCHGRTGYTECIEVHSPSGGPTLLAYARNLSRGGIAFISSVPIALEPKLLTLPQRDRTPLRIHAQVVRCVRIAEGLFDAAAQFQHLARS